MTLKIRRLFILIFSIYGSACVFSSLCSAAVPKYNYLDEVSQSGAIDRELVVAYEAIRNEKPAYDYNKLIPSNIASMVGQTAVEAMADKGVNDWWMNSELKQSDMGQTVDKVEKAMRQEVSFRSANSKIEHKFVMQYLAFQARTELKYSGLADAQVYYTQKNSTLGIEMSEKLTQNESLVFNHQINPVENVSKVSLLISF